MGHVVDLGLLNQTTAFHLSWQDTVDIQLVTAGLCTWLSKRIAAPQACYREQNWTRARLHKHPKKVNIYSHHSDPKEMLQWPNISCAVKHSNFHQCAPMPCNSLAIRSLVDGNATVTQNAIWPQSIHPSIRNCRHLRGVLGSTLCKASSNTIKPLNVKLLRQKLASG